MQVVEGSKQRAALGRSEGVEGRPTRYAHRLRPPTRVIRAAKHYGLYAKLEGSERRTRGRRGEGVDGLDINILNLDVANGRQRFAPQSSSFASVQQYVDEERHELPHTSVVLSQMRNCMIASGRHSLFAAAAVAAVAFGVNNPDLSQRLARGTRFALLPSCSLYHNMYGIDHVVEFSAPPKIKYKVYLCILQPHLPPSCTHRRPSTRHLVGEHG